MRRTGIRATLLILLFFPTALPAQTPRSNEAQRQALACEQRGDWLEACRWYDEAYRRDRTRLDCREAYQRCLRLFHLQNRHRDPAYREVLARLTASRALDVYQEVLFILSVAYVDPNRIDRNTLFQQGLREVRLALDDSTFRKEHLAGVRPELIRHFQKRLESWPERKLETRADIREEVLAVVGAAQQLGLGDRQPPLGPVLILEFACGACSALDEYSLFLTPSHFSDVQATLRGRTVGIGIDVTLVAGRLEISRVYPKSPAEELGLIPRDRILKIDRQPIEHQPLEWIADRLRGEVGTLLELEILSAGQMMPHPVKLVRRPVAVPSVESRILPDTPDAELLGYLRIYSFQESTLQEVKDALVQLQTNGIKGLIVDLRGNPGGLFKSAVQVAELFLGTGVIVYGQSQLREFNKSFKADIHNPLLLPVAVLVDFETASSAEVLAGALKDSGRARLFGQTTYGKGSIQSVIPLRKTAGGIRLTVAQLLSPTRQPVTGRGVVPHDFVDTENDTCIAAAQAHLLGLLRMVMR